MNVCLCSHTKVIEQLSWIIYSPAFWGIQLKSWQKKHLHTEPSLWSHLLNNVSSLNTWPTNGALPITSGPQLFASIKQVLWLLHCYHSIVRKLLSKEKKKYFELWMFWVPHVRCGIFPMFCHQHKGSNAVLQVQQFSGHQHLEVTGCFLTVNISAMH